MSKEYNEIWIEKIFRKIPIPYPIVSLFTAVIIFSIYWFFSTKIFYFPWDFVDRLVVSTLSILIALQIAGIQYVLNKIKKNFMDLLLFPKSVESVDDLYVKLEHRLYSSYWYYVIITFVIFPFILFELIHLFRGGETYYTLEPTVWSFLLEIYNHVIGYLVLFLLAIIVWIIFYIAWTFYKIRSDHCKHLMQIDIFCIDKIGGLKPLRNFVLQFLAFYFICITLAIISYISPDRIFSYNSFFLVILLLVGISFFITALKTIQTVVKGKIEYEINLINKKYKEEYQRLMDIISRGNYMDKEKELNLVSNTIKTLSNERERRLQLYDRAKGYDFITIIQFIISFIPPILAFFQKFTPLVVYLKEFIPSGTV